MGGIFRVDYSGRGELAERQQALGRVLSKMQKMSEEFNVAVLMTNQVMADPGGGCAFMPSHPRPIGGHVLAHFSTTCVFLRKGCLRASASSKFFLAASVTPRTE